MENTLSSTNQSSEPKLFASGFCNKVSENEFFLMLDYDQVEFEVVEKEVKSLQFQFNLSNASIYQTKNGFHVYFFEDNEFSKEKITEILIAAKNIDPHFLEGWLELSEKGEGSILRTGGKYTEMDISFFTEIKGIRISSILQRSVAESFKKSVELSIEKPIFNYQLINEKYEELFPEKGQSLKTEKNSPISSVKEERLYPVGNSEKTSEKRGKTEKNNEYSSEKIPVDKKALPTVNSLHPKNVQISELRKKWFFGVKGASVARLISASCADREFAVMVPQDYAEKTSEKNYFPTRCIFLSNDLVVEKMINPWTTIFERKDMETLPYNLFQTHATYDRANLPTPPFIGKEHDEFSEFFRKDSYKYINGFDIVFDFDSKEEKEDIKGNIIQEKIDAYLEAKKMRDLLKSMNIPHSVTFSGSKGFHVRIPARLTKYLVPELAEFLKLNPNNAHVFFKNLLNFANKHNIQADPAAYNGNARCLIRVPWTIHQATGCIVKPLTDEAFDALNGKTIQEIREIFRADNQLTGNKKIGAEKINFLQKDPMIIKIVPMGHEEYMSWEEMRDSGLFDQSSYDEQSGKNLKEWEHYRNTMFNPAAKELRALSNSSNPEDVKKFIHIIESGIY